MKLLILFLRISVGPFKLTVSSFLGFEYVLWTLCEPPYEPLAEASLWTLTKKWLFLLSLAMAWRVSELQAVSSQAGFHGADTVLSFLMMFIAKTESTSNPPPQSFVIKSLSSFVGEHEFEKFLSCSSFSLLFCISLTLGLQPYLMFVSLCCSSRPLSKESLVHFCAR